MKRHETQTAYALVLKFGLCEEKDRQRFAGRLAEMIRENGMRMTTGFLGTPYLLHALTENGYKARCICLNVANVCDYAALRTFVFIFMYSLEHKVCLFADSCFIL